MTTQLSHLPEAYVQATNRHDAEAFLALFTEDALVNDNGREFRGRDAIREWSEREIFAADVTLDVLAAVDHDGRTVVTSRVDGTFDRTGLPDPLLIDHEIEAKGGRIVRLTCRLARESA